MKHNLNILDRTPRLIQSAFCFFLILFPLQCAEDQITVPVSIQIEPFYQLSLSSVAVEMDKEGNVVGEKEIANSGLFFGTVYDRPGFLSRISKKKNTDPLPITFSSSHYTITQVNVSNNVKPFNLDVEILVDESTENLITNLKQQSNPAESSFQIRVRRGDNTLHIQNIVEENVWRGVAELPRLHVYESGGEVVSDGFYVDFALRDLTHRANLGQYGGRVIWMLYSEL
jgi:hypothetical protein